MIRKVISRRRAQRGVAAILLALMVLVFTGILAVSLFLRRGQSERDNATHEQLASLERARNLLVGFVVREGRLPCAAQSPNGSEDCAATNPKGWLPTGTLDPVASAPNTQGRLPVRYMVYRAPGADLTSATTNEYIPSDAGGTPLADYPVVNSTLDTCRKLYLMASPAAPGATPPPLPPPMPTVNMADTPTRWSMAYGLKGTAADTRQPYVMVGTDIVNVAFGLAVPPAGASAASSGANAIATSAQMEIPGRKPDANYRDQVLIEDAGALSRTLGCGPVQASVDLMAMAAGWPAAAAATRQGNIDLYGALLGIQGANLLSETLSLIESGIEAQEAFELNRDADYYAGVGGSLSLGIATAVTQDMVRLTVKLLAAAVAAGVAQALSFTLETANLAIYAERLDAVLASYVWEDAQPLILAADQLGIKP